MQLNMELKQVKVTKNKVRFDQVGTDDGVSIYLAKTDLPTPFPEEISITISAD